MGKIGEMGELVSKLLHIGNLAQFPSGFRQFEYQTLSTVVGWALPTLHHIETVRKSRPYLDYGASTSD